MECHEILSYPIMYTVQQCEMRKLLKSGDFSEIERFVCN